MAIDKPQTYGDFYWRNQVEASRAFDEGIEEAVSPYLSSLLGEVKGLSEIPAGFQNFLKGLTEPHSPGMGGFLTSAAGEFSAEMLKQLLDPAMKMMRRKINRDSLETWLSVPQAMRLKQRNDMTDEYFRLIMSSDGYEDTIAEQVYKSMFPYPSIPDLMLYSRYHGNPDNTREKVWEYFDVPAEHFDIWEWQTKQRLTTEQVQRLYKRGLLTETELFNELAQIGWYETDRPLMKELGYVVPNAMLLIQGGLLQEKPTDKIIEDISKADIHPDWAKTYYDAVLTKPSTFDYIAYELRQDPELNDIEHKLEKLGIHPDYTDVYKTLANPIPPINDLVTMAVREAFTPDIATRFGQYEDFPPAFEEWMGKKGVTKEWAERYWAAHWSLPSPSQGFTMLHRGIIDENDLNKLLRALDIMPFWRDKLIQVAYRPLTRVDVRRMYREGILDEEGVYDAYLDHGYNEKNAKAMTDFTIQYVLTQQTKFNTRDVLTAYHRRMIKAGTARDLLSMLGVKGSNLDFIITTANYKRDWEFTDQRIRGIKNMYKRKQYDADKARGELLKLNIATEQVDVLMKQWWFEVKEEPTQPWTVAQTIKFMRRDLISQSRAKDELSKLGYDDEHINIYIKDALWTPPEN